MGYFVKNRRLQSGSSGVVIPTGNTVQRPTDPTFGLIRYNTDSGYIEYFDGSIFQSLGTTGGINYAVDSFTGDGSTTTFGPLSSAVGTTDVIVFVGSIYQQPTTTYTITGGGTNITFTSAPPIGVPINVIISSV